MRFYVGTYTRQGGPGICEVRWIEGHATVRVVADTPDPSFLALHPAGHAVYAVNEQPEGAVSAFRVDSETGDLRLLGAATTGGGAPCHLAVHPSGKWLAVANYRGASVAIFAIREDGSLGPRTDLTAHRGHGVHPERQRQPHPHGVYWHDQGRQLWVPDLGTDSIVLHSFDPGTGILASQRARIALPAGCGPRHLALPPHGTLAYCLNELDSTLVALSAEVTDGTWHPQAPQSTLPAGFSGRSAAAEIVLHPGGRWLFCSNRGDDSLAVFDLAENPAKPRLAGHIPCGGRTPRHFALTADGRGFVIANQESNIVTLFRAKTEDPLGYAVAAMIPVRAPSCVLMTGIPTG